MGPLGRLIARLRGATAEDRDAIWKRGERAAASHLKRKGYRVVSRNLRLPAGEIDLLCRAGKHGGFVLVEVKARTRDGSERRPEDAITSAKKRKLLLLARLLMRDPAVREAGLRIDVVAIEFERGRRRAASIRHYERAVSDR